jgi:predicted nucleic acid-binding protein
LLYLDASALVKLVQPEPETAALLHELGKWPFQVSSPITEVEVRRAARRTGQPVRPTEEILAQLSFLPLDEDMRRVAGNVGSPALRSLDAIHLASALSLGDDLGAFCCYDRRLRADAEDAGLTVLSPGLH